MSSSADELPLRSLYEQVTAQPSDPKAEANRLEASHHQAERHGNDLMIWQNSGEPGLVFRNFSFSAENGMTDGADFTYFGGTDLYNLVLKHEDHDAPTLYLIEKSGKILKFLPSESLPYASPTGRRLLEIGYSLDFAILGMTQTQGYQYELRCNGNPKANEFPRVLSFTDDLIELEWSLHKAPVGIMKLVRDGRVWKIAEPTEKWNWFACDMGTNPARP